MSGNQSLEQANSGGNIQHLGPSFTEIEKFQQIAATLSQTIQSVNEIQSSIIKKAGGISEEGRKSILDDIKQKIEHGKESIIHSLNQHTNTINQTLTQIVERVEDLKVVVISPSG